MDRKAARLAAASVGVSVFLCVLNLVIAWASGSLAVAAELTHNLVDLAASVGVLLGLRIAQRRSRAFPYGLYKVENLVAVGVAVLIFLTGYEIAREALLAGGGAATVTRWVLTGVAVSALVPWAFSVYELRVGRQLNSPSLMADAQEYRAHVLSSGVVFLALIGQHFRLPLDQYAALAIVLFIGKTGWGLLVGGMRVLLDASVDTATLEQARRIVQAEPAVARLVSVMGRNSGRYCFLEAEVELRMATLEKAHAVCARLEGLIRRRVPNVERVLLHCGPQARTHVRFAVPLAATTGAISPHFGEAPHFALVTVRVTDGAIEQQEVRANPHLEEEKAKGIRVSEWLVGLKCDVVLLQETTQGRGPDYVFADAGVEARITAQATLADALAEQPEVRDPAGARDTIPPASRPA